MTKSMDMMQTTGKDVFTSSSILSASKLFKYRKQSDRSIPNVGGNKEFQPDGSWLQAKKLEKFYEERKDLLSEERVERVGNLVIGDWNPDKHLVELHKELGKFWVYMGFADKNRKWLYPEEALYLMETNMMEVMYKELPLSIQQAYRNFIGQYLTLEQYQVYTHLRRLGYVLIRHQERLDITQYGRKINLDQHIRPKNKKAMKRKAKGQCNVSTPKKVKDDLNDKKKHDCNSESSFPDVSDCNDKVSICNIQPREPNVDMDYCSSCTDSSNLCNTEEKMDTDEFNDPETKSRASQHRITSSVKYVTYRMKSFERTTESEDFIDLSQPLSESDKISSRCPQWNFSQIHFPDIGKEKILTIYKHDKSKHLFPPGVNIADTFTFDAEKYNQKFSVKIMDNDREEIEYSFPPGLDWTKQIKAKNWTEYKAKLREIESSGDGDVIHSPVAHLWKGDVTPLVSPGDAVNVGGLLRKLQVVKNVKPSISERFPENGIKKYKVLYDVYLPDAKFKKSCPGRPNHRLCVLSHGEALPDIYSLSILQHRYSEGIPIHWAVVDHGDIAFYSFTNFDIPVLL